MGYVTDIQLQSLIHLPVSLPLTEVGPESWLVVSTILINQPWTFTLNVLQLNLLSLADTTTGADTLSTAPTADGVCVFPSSNASLVTQNQGLAYLGLYLNFNSQTSPTTQVAQEVPLILGNAGSTPPVYALRTAAPATYAAPGAYSFVLINNTQDFLLRMSITGNCVLNIGPT